MIRSMPGKQDLGEELNHLSGVLSQRIRVLAGGVLAFCWAFVIEGASGEKEAFLPPGYSLPPMILALVGLVADFLQYWFGYRLNIVLLRRLEAEERGEVAYDRRHIYYRLREKMFGTKIALVCLAVFFLLLVVSIRLFQVYAIDINL